MLGIYIWGMFGCTSIDQSDQASMEVTNPKDTVMDQPVLDIERSVLYDKVLGMLIGSAIGDAMGAPTEMWSRYNIQVEYGHVDSLDDMVREPSPEGTWAFNLPAGGTTDDTRWKILLADYLTRPDTRLYAIEGPDPYAFARFIVNRYQQEIAGLAKTQTFDPRPIEYQARRMAWLQEWAIVAKPFAEKDLEAYTYALHHFYGGEMTCAGMLYAPMLGLVYPGAATHAYQAAYRLGMFDLGYARDITALTAAMVAAAMKPQTTPEQVLRVMRDIDPNRYFESRLVGRTAYRIYRDVRYMVYLTHQLSIEEARNMDIQIPIKDQDTLQAARLQQMYTLLDDRNQDMPFHAGEIHMINLAALMFCDFDFMRSMEFVINYGRDNDTVGAVTGAILGAFHGKDNLPTEMVNTVLATNKDQLGIDMESWAETLTDMMVESVMTTSSSK